MITYKQIFWASACIIMLVFSGCASKPTIYSDFDPRHKFSSDKTFTWVHTPPILRSGDYPVTALAETRMTAAIKSELIMRGYSFVEHSDDADFSVVYTMGARDKIEFSSSDTDYYSHRYDWGWGEYYFPYFAHFPFNRNDRYRESFSSYTKGDIAIDIFDTKTKQPIWHTKASKKLSKKDLNSEAKNAGEIAKQLLQHFPWRGCQVVASDQCKPFD